MAYNTVAVVEMLALLNRECVNVKQIHEATGLAKGTVISYLKMLKSRKLIRVAEWHRYGNCHNWCPHYEWNPDGLYNALKPSPMTIAERKARRRKINKDKNLGLL